MKVTFGANMEAGIENTLTDRQARFVFEYLKDQNASAAAVRAGYSEKTRASQASDLMKNPAVRERIRIEMAGLLAELKASALDLMKERMRAAFFRAGKMFDAAGGVLALAEMEAETRAALLVTVVMRKWGPEIRLRQPNREKALSALEKVHERLDKLNEQYYEKLEREAARQRARERAHEQSQEWAEENPQAARAPAAMWPVPRFGEGEEGGAQEGAGQGAQAGVASPAAQQSNPVSPHQTRQAAAPLAVPTVAAPAAAAPAAATPAVAASAPPASTEKPQVLSVSPVPIAEKPRVLSGSPAKAAKPSILAKALAVLAGEKKAPEPKPIVRRDPNILWGGTRKWTPPPPSPALLEHLARVKHQELNEEVRREMAARGGKIRPGELRPVGMDPGYNPPWLRDNRPQFAIGAGEFSFDD